MKHLIEEMFLIKASFFKNDPKINNICAVGNDFNPDFNQERLVKIVTDLKY